MNLDFPSSPGDGQFSVQPNGVTYRYNLAKLRWEAYLTPVAPAILGAITLLTTNNPAWVPDERTVFIRFTLTGGGGGGGGVAASAGQASLSNGGCGGATAIKGSDVIDPTYAIVVGNGGSGGAGGQNDGNDGNNSTLVSATLNLLAAGGFKGTGRSSGTNQNRVGTQGPLATGGDLNIPGGDSQSGATIDGRSTISATSGASWWGHGRLNPHSATARDGNAPGVGGSGNSSADSSTNRPGGDGATGICQIEEFFAAPATA